MKSFRLMLGAAVAVAGLGLASAAEAAPGGIKVGELTCNVSSGWGFIFGSSKDLRCAPSSDIGPGALSGTYVGGSAQATVGVGAGANALIGGLNKSIALQPLSLEGSKGLNVAAGIGSITLKPAP